MKNNTPIFAKLPLDNISLEDCMFYHVMDIPGLSEPTKGEWDLRKGVDEYLGHLDFNNKTVLELGPASGYITFHIEKLGAKVTRIDLPIKKDLWINIRRVKDNWQEELNALIKKIAMTQKAYWYAHKAFNSKAKLILSHVNDLPEEIGIYDISLMCSVILHLQNPFLGIQNMLRHTKEKAIITELGGYTRIKSFRNTIRNLIRRIMRPPPSMTFIPDEGRTPFKWWYLSPEVIVNMANILGFEKNTITYHKQKADGRNTWFFTVVCERTVPIENCNYD